jgi:ABC-type Fe3+ transport system permease subunit
MITAAVEPFDAGLVEAGRTLGASRLFCLTRLVLPLLAPAIAAATALVFALSLGEFVASILLYVQANIPISMQIFMEMRGSGIGSAFAYSMFLMLLVAVTFVVARRFGSRMV